MPPEFILETRKPSHEYDGGEEGGAGGGLDLEAFPVSEEAGWPAQALCISAGRPWLLSATRV